VPVKAAVSEGAASPELKEVTQVADPPETGRALQPGIGLPSLSNVTVPVGEPESGVMIAVSVTGWLAPTVGGAALSLGRGRPVELLAHV
jgi:hypothetical protein